MFEYEFLLFLHKTQKIYRKNIDLLRNLGYNVKFWRDWILIINLILRGEYFGCASGRYPENEKEASLRL